MFTSCLWCCLLLFITCSHLMVFIYFVNHIVFHWQQRHTADDNANLQLHIFHQKGKCILKLMLKYWLLYLLWEKQHGLSWWHQHINCDAFSYLSHLCPLFCSSKPNLLFNSIPHPSTLFTYRYVKFLFKLKFCSGC